MAAGSCAIVLEGQVMKMGGCGQIWSTVALISLIALVFPLGHAGAQDQRDASVRAAVVELARIKQSGDVLLLYDLLHPDARLILPRSALATWYSDTVVPNGDPEILAVDFGEWTWPVTEDAYSDVATVHLHQSGVRDGVEVVQTETQHLWFDGARWRWFFGFDMEYLDGFMRQVPSDATPSAQFSELDHARLNMVWSEIFAIAGAPYDAPDGVNVFNIMDLPLQTGCGWLTAEDYAEAFYCDLDQELYFESGFRDTIERDYGPDAWTVALAWVWANHLQFQLGIDASEQPELDGGMYPIEVYLQADCLTGVYVQEAIARGWLVPASTDTMQLLYDLIGDLSETPFDDADAHGTGEQRWQAFTAGLEDGLLGCDLDLTAAG